VPQRDSSQRSQETPLLRRSFEPSHHLAQTFILWPLLGPDSSKDRFLDLTISSPLQNWALPRIMDNRKKNHNVPRITISQDFLVGHDQQDPKLECAGCQRMRIHMGALNSTLTFELETLSHHRHLIERLQDEIFAQRSQIEEQCSYMEILQSRMDQMERSHQQPNTPTSTQGASKNLTSATVNQIRISTSPYQIQIGSNMDTRRPKRNWVAEFVKFKCHVLFYVIYKWSFL
jgi:hypothetical protein